MSQTVTKWVAWVARNHRNAATEVRVLPISVRESEKRFTVLESDPNYSEMRWALEYRSHFNKSENRTLFDSDVEALGNLCRRCIEQEVDLRQKWERAKEVTNMVEEKLGESLCK